MGFRINTNVLSLNAQRNLGNSAKAFGQALQQLSSGSRINRAGDDAAGLAISEGLNSQVRGTAVAIRNSNDAIGFLNTAEGGLAELTNITQRLRELAVQSSNGTLGTSSRTYLNGEATQLLQEFERIATQTQFNGVNLLDGSFSTTNLQVGIQKGQTIAFNIGNAQTSALGSLATISGLRAMISTAGLSGLIINGQAVYNTVASDDTYSSTGNSYSAIAIATRINQQSGVTQVAADIQSTLIEMNNLDFSGYSGNLSNDGFAINGINITGTGVTSTNAFIQAVNNFSSQTGVAARLQTGGATSSVELYANDGRNIALTISGATAFAGSYSVAPVTGTLVYVLEDSGGVSGTSNFGAGLSVGTMFSSSYSTFTISMGISTVRTGAIKLRSSAAININGANVSSQLGISGTLINVDSTITVNSISLLTQNLASDALAYLDATLSQLNSVRAGLGATQSRLDSTISSLSVTLENISSAKSQIRDTDVAQATADLTRAQILQQAGIAVLGQANSSSQAALKLLQGL